MAAKKSVKKFTGVYFSESGVRKWHERPDKCFWVAFKRNGKLIWERCGWSSEGWTAEAAQRRRYELLELERVGAYKPRKERERDTLTFGDLMEGHYLPWADSNKTRAPEDRSFYRCWLAPRFREKTLNEISPISLERLKKEMRDAGKAEATVKHVLCLVRQACNKAVSWNLWSGENPCRHVRFPRPNNSRQRYLTHHEAEILLKTIKERSPQVARIAAFSLFLGLRLREIFSLRWSNVDLEAGVITVLNTKNGESRQVFITNHILEVIHEIGPAAPEEFLFKNKHDRQVAWLSKLFRTVVESLGFNKGIEDSREKVCFHSLRHTFASWAAMEGLPLYLIGRGLGHKTSAMTERYSHLSPESQRLVFEAVARSQTAKKTATEQSNAN